MDRFACRLCVAVFALPPALPDRIVEAAGLLISLKQTWIFTKLKSFGTALKFSFNPKQKAGHAQPEFRLDMASFYIITSTASPCGFISQLNFRIFENRYLFCLVELSLLKS